MSVITECRHTCVPYHSLQFHAYLCDEFISSARLHMPREQKSHMYRSLLDTWATGLALDNTSWTMPSVFAHGFLGSLACPHYRSPRITGLPTRPTSSLWCRSSSCKRGINLGSAIEHRSNHQRWCSGSGLEEPHKPGLDLSLLPSRDLILEAAGLVEGPCGSLLSPDPIVQRS